MSLAVLEQQVRELCQVIVDTNSPDATVAKEAYLIIHAARCSVPDCGRRAAFGSYALTEHLCYEHLTEDISIE